jgi:Protein kinase domain
MKHHAIPGGANYSERQTSQTGTTNSSEDSQSWALATGSVRTARIQRYEVIGKRYEMIREIGAGGMATVLLARDHHLERLVAIKLLLSDTREHRQRLFNEARITARCAHDSVVAVIDAGVDQDWGPYIVLEYLHGRTLATLLEAAGRLAYARAVEIVMPLLRALQQAHDLGIVHRDLKPENVFLTDSGVIKLLDFGVAKVLEPQPAQHWRPGAYAAGASLGAIVSSSQLTGRGMVLGTWAYLSPEHLGASPVDHRSDLWAVGILLFQMIGGRHPLYPREGSELVVIALPDTPMPSLAEVAPADVPPELIRVVDRCLSRNKEQRWQSAGQLLAALSACLPGGAGGACSAPPQGAPVVASDGPTLPDAVHPPDADHDAAIERVERVAPTAPARDGAGHGAVVLPFAPAAFAPSQSERQAMLFVAADPAGAGDGTLGRRARVIRHELERTLGRDRFALVDCPAPEIHDVLRFLRRHRPIAVVFAGSGRPAGEPRAGQRLLGSNVGGLWLRGRDGTPQLVTPTSLQETFGAAGSSVKLVFLDRAYTKLQAAALLAHVDCVVGTPGTASAEIAEAYAIGLFGALGDYEPVASAHRHGCAAASMLIPPGGDDRPRIEVRPGVDAGQLILAR